MNEQGSLVAINVDDLSRDLSAGIFVTGWSTDPIDDAWFEPSADWKCEGQQFLDYAEQLAEWDIIRMFFPVEPVPLLDEPVPGPVPAAQGSSSRRLWSV